MNALDAAVLPAGIRSRFASGVNGLRMHVLEAGPEKGPCLLLLHGFPELAFSWRRIMPALAEAGYRVIAPDQRGYGRTSAAPVGYDDDLAPYEMLGLVTDMVCLLAALDCDHVAAVIGHDYGSIVAGCCALVRPDLFRSLVSLSAPFSGAPPRATPAPFAPESDPIHAALAALAVPRKHYQLHFAGRSAGPEMNSPPQGMHDFLRAYYSMKSADWAGNRPAPLTAWSATELARMPGYYVMPLSMSMPEVVAPELSTAECEWLTDAELGMCVAEFTRTGFQGGLQWYRCGTNGSLRRNLLLFAGRRIEVPMMFAAGRSDWCPFQVPGALDAMAKACAKGLETHFIDGAGHWIQQEQPGAVTALLLEFLIRTNAACS